MSRVLRRRRHPYYRRLKTAYRVLGCKAELVEYRREKVARLARRGLVLGNAMPPRSIWALVRWRVELADEGFSYFWAGKSKNREAAKVAVRKHAQRLLDGDRPAPRKVLKIKWPLRGAKARAAHEARKKESRRRDRGGVWGYATPREHVVTVSYPGRPNPDLDVRIVNAAQARGDRGYKRCRPPWRSIEFSWGWKRLGEAKAAATRLRRIRVPRLEVKLLVAVSE